MTGQDPNSYQDGEVNVRMGISRRQQQILEFIATTVSAKGYPPSVREIGDSVGLSSSSTVHGHLSRLEELGYIRRDPTKPRAIELLRAPAGFRPPLQSDDQVAYVPILGRIAAGQPILAVENIDDTFPLPWNMVRGANCFLLEVKGDSMIDAGIRQGDLVLVRQQATAENGEIVAALLGEDATIKRLYRDRGRVRLVAANPAYAPIEAQDVQILGKVVGLIRMFD